MRQMSPPPTPPKYLSQEGLSECFALSGSCCSDDESDQLPLLAVRVFVNHELYSRLNLDL